MPRKITNIYKQGLPSKLYFLAYSKPRSIYEISKIIYGFPQPQRLYKYRDQMMREDSLRRLKSAKPRWQATPNPIINEIDFVVKKKGIKIDRFDKKLIWKILDSSFFRSYVGCYNQDMSGEFDGLQILLQIFDLWLIMIFNFRLENTRRYKKETGEIPYPLDRNQSEKFLEVYKKMEKKTKKQILIETKSGIKKYAKTQELLNEKKINEIFEQQVNEIMGKPKGFGYDTFIYPELFFKLLKDKNLKEWSTLSPMGISYIRIIFQAHTTKEIGPFMLAKFNSIIKRK